MCVCACVFSCVCVFVCVSRVCACVSALSLSCYTNPFSDCSYSFAERVVNPSCKGLNFRKWVLGERPFALCSFPNCSICFLLGLQHSMSQMGNFVPFAEGFYHPLQVNICGLKKRQCAHRSHIWQKIILTRCRTRARARTNTLSPFPAFNTH